MEKYRPEDLHDYPPRIICRLFPEKNAPKRTSCTISLSGLLPQDEFYIPLKILTPKVAADTTKLQVFTFVYSIVVSYVSICGEDQEVLLAFKLIGLYSID